MIENRLRSEFLREFIEDIEEKAAKTGSYQIPFLEKMISFMDRDDEPEILVPPFTDSIKNIAVNAYSYNEENSSLDLFVAEYSFEQNEDELLSINRSALTDIANKAKRFFTNAKTLLNSIDQSMEAYDLAKLIENDKTQINEVNIFVVTNMYYTANKAVEITIPAVDSVNVQIWDIDRVQQLITAEQGIQSDYIDFENELGETFEMMFVPDPIQGGTKTLIAMLGIFLQSCSQRLMKHGDRNW